MKKQLLVLTMAVVFSAMAAMAQAPQQLNYQAVVRNASGQPVAAGTNVSVRFEIHDGSDTGTVVYTETTTAVANQFGLISLRIGGSGNLATVNWGGGAKYLDVAIDPTGGASFIDMGTSQLISVPYALFAANSAGSVGPTGPQGIAGPAGPAGTGPQGPIGAQGLQGVPGAAGAQGNAGATGTNGAAGAQGVQGIQGVTGAQGPVGPTGSDGAQGPAGAAGATGPQGATGFLPDGTAAGNTTYWDGAQWAVNSSTIYNNGTNVGIGTTSPSHTLDVNGGQVVMDLQDNYGGLHVQGAGGGEASIALEPDNVAWGQAGEWILYTNGSQLSNQHDFAIFNSATGTPGFFIQAATNNVGIGTSNPGATLTVNGTFAYTDGSQQNGYVLTSDANGNASWQPTGIGSITAGTGISISGNTINSVWSVNGNNIYNNNSAGVGIGTVPNDLFDVLPSGGNDVFLGGGNSTGSEIKLTNNGTYHFSMYNSGNSVLTFANTSGAFQTNTPGNVLMTLDPNGNLAVTGSITSNGSGLPAGSGSNNYLARWTSNSTLGTGVAYDNGSSVGIGTTSPNYLFEVSGGDASMDNNLFVGNNAQVTGASNLNGGLTTRDTAYVNYGGSAEIFANGDNHSGGGIAVSDDGGFYDYNDSYITYNGSTGLKIAGNNGPASNGQLLVQGNTSVTGGVQVTGASNLNGGLTTSDTAYVNFGGAAEILANGDDHTGGGIAVSNDGGFYDYNDNWITYNGTTGLRIAGNSGQGSTGNTLEVDGNFIYNNGGQQNGYVLTSDASGNATWAAPVPPTVADTGTINQIDVTNGPTGNTIAIDPAYTAALKSQAILTGGGTITFDNSYELSWTNRFIDIDNGTGSQFSANGYFDINMPGVGATITGVGGAGDVTITSGGVPLGGWEALYYILPVGSGNTSIDANFRVVGFGSNFAVPENWVMIGAVNGDDQSIRLGDGATLALGQTWTAANGNATPNLTGAVNQIDIITKAAGADSVMLDPGFADAVKAGFALTGGGNIIYDNSDEISWSNRFIVICNGSGSQFSTAGYFDINLPGVGSTITGAGGAGDVVVTGGGIPMNGWQALYYILPVGSSSSSLDGNFRITSYGSGMIVPENWILIALQNGDDNSIRFGNGIILQQGQTWAAGSGTAPANSVSNSYIQNTTSTQSSANFDIDGSGIVGSNMVVGLNASTPAKLNVVQGGTDPSTYSNGKVLFATGSIGSGQNYDGGMEFRHDNLSEGIGFGYNTIYATGYNSSQDLNLIAMGSGNVNLQAYGGVTGNVGIGTNNPQYLLDVNGKTGIDGYNDGAIYMNGTKNTNRGLEWYYSSTDRYGLAQANNGNLALYTSTGYGPSFISFNLSNDYGTGFSELMRITHAGLVGIGTSNPQSLLDVNGGAAIGSYAGNNAAPSNGLIVSGNVGIATPSPSVALDIETGSSPAFKLNDGTQQNGYVLTSDGSGNASWQSPNQVMAYQYINPTDGGNYTLQPGQNGVLIILNGSGPLASYTIQMPANPVDGQIVTIAAASTGGNNYSINSFTISPNAGQAIDDNAPTSFVFPNTHCSFAFNNGNGIWVRIN